MGRRQLLVGDIRGYELNTRTLNNCQSVEFFAGGAAAAAVVIVGWLPALTGIANGSGQSGI